MNKLQAKGWKKGAALHAGLIFLWASVGMLREIEVRTMRVKNVLRCDQQKWAAIRLAGDVQERSGGLRGPQDVELLW